MTILNRTIFTRDNLEVLRGMNSGSVDLVYLDPPFNSKKAWNAPIGSKAAGAAFKDTWTLSDIDVQTHDRLRTGHRDLHDVILAARAAGGNGTMSYLLMMSERLLELQRVLKPEGSLYLHCDPTESHSLKLMLDVIFGRSNFRNEIVWAYTGPSSPHIKQFPRKTDIILWYSKSNEWVFNREAVRVPYKDPNQTLRKALDAGRGIDEDEVSRYRERGKIVENWWSDIALAVRSPSERVGYPTQKPVALLQRIIKASSNPDDVVLDPFAGCATAAIAAEDLGRQWVGIDLSDKAAELVKYRLREHLGLFYDIIHRTDIPARTDLGRLPKPSTHKKSLYGEQGGDCNGCGTHFRIVDFHIDHIVPKSKGGTDVRTNLQLLCGHCNSRKGNQSMSLLMTKLLAERGIKPTIGKEEQ